MRIDPGKDWNAVQFSGRFVVYRAVVVTALVLAIAALLHSAGCGGAGRDASPSPPSTGSGTSRAISSTTSSLAIVPTSAVTTTASSSEPSASTTTSQSEAEGSTQVFVELAGRLAAIPVYGFDDLPAGATLPAEWWPVTNFNTPSEYEGATRANPWVADHPGADPEAQVLLEYRSGWLAVLENFRGDLGDSPGEEVRSVAGHAAARYQVNGGTLVQWSDGGRWYGLFGRGVPPQEVIRLLLQIRLIAPSDRIP